MRKRSSIILLLLSLMVLGAVLTGCDSTAWVPPSSSAAFASLRADGVVLTAQSRAAQRAARQTAKAAHTARQQRPRPNAIEPGSVNIYVWSEAASGKETKVTSEAIDILSVHMSADGTKGVFSAYSSDGYYQIYLGTLPANGAATTDAVQLTTDAIDHYGPQMSPDGSQVVFVESGDGDQLCLVSTSGGTPNCLEIAGFTPANYGHPTWTPNGKIVVEAWDCFQDDCVEGDVVDNIFMVNTNGTGLTQLTENSGMYDYDEAPSISSDGTTMATAYQAGDAYTEIYVTNLSTLARTKLTDGNATYADSFDPLFVGSSQIVYVSEQELDNSYRLYVMGATGGTATAISADIYDNYFDYDWY